MLHQVVPIHRDRYAGISAIKTALIDQRGSPFGAAWAAPAGCGDHDRRAPVTTQWAMAVVFTPGGPLRLPKYAAPWVRAKSDASGAACQAQRLGAHQPSAQQT